ncbi:hypothetical protein N0B51_10480 [Tsuneonella sp. YG55]|uniref:Uncharacterized protein n=1 Tax=Tsuneonella litorea TaxID=2976475 RepID=A0A9X2W380_9SPHN|nr:hypothetical protein [Tsuneonella litorea]MCT2559404.1 hypothetical protein [Tsuneonella litorea]
MAIVSSSTIGAAPLALQPAPVTTEALAAIHPSPQLGRPDLTSHHCLAALSGP